MPTSAEIRVRGDAEVRCLPDRAILRIVVEAEAEAQPQAYALAAQSAASVDAVLDRFAQAIERRMTAGVIVRPRTRWRKGETVRTGWAAGRTTAVEVTNFSHLGQLVADLAGAGASALHGPDWEVDKTNPAHDEARRAAALDAQRRASTYAEAVGLRLGPLKWLAEPGLRDDAGSPFPVAAGARFLHADAAAPDEPMDLTPDEVTLPAIVEACFELVAPQDTSADG